jgi:hypothetical protein
LIDPATENSKKELVKGIFFPVDADVILQKKKVQRSMERVT